METSIPLRLIVSKASLICFLNCLFLIHLIAVSHPTPSFGWHHSWTFLDTICEIQHSLFSIQIPYHYVNCYIPIPKEEDGFPTWVHNTPKGEAKIT